MAKKTYTIKTKSFRKPRDQEFVRKADLLCEWMTFHNRFPSAKATTAGRRTIEHPHGTFLSAQRRYLKGYEKTGRPTIRLKSERFLYLKQMHPEIFNVHKGNRSPTFLPTLVEEQWSYVFEKFYTMDRMKGIDKSDYCFSFESKRPYLGTKSLSYKEHMIRSFSVAFSPSMCYPASPVGTMQRVCSYIFVSSRPDCQPNFMKEDTASPRKIFLQTQLMNEKYHHKYMSSYFAPETVPSEIKITCEIALFTILPCNIFECLKASTSIEEIVSIYQQHDYAFDTFFFGVGGKVGYKSLINIVDSSFPQPRRINFSCTQ